MRLAAPGVRRAGVRLDVGEYLALWRRLRLGELPVALYTLDHGRSYAERHALDVAAWERLGARGLVDARGVPDGELADTLSVLARPAREVDAFVATRGSEPQATLAAARGDLGVVAALVDGELRLDPADPEELARGLLARLPREPAATGSPMSLPMRAATGDGVALEERAHRLRRAGVPPHQVERLRAMWAEPPTRVTTFGVTVRDVGGARRRGGRVLTVVDTVVGRVVWAPDPTGRHLLVRPVDDARLGAEVAALLAVHERDVRGPRR